MQSVYDQGAFAPCPAPFNMAGYVLESGAQTPDKIALQILHPDRTEDWSYAQVRQAILGFARGFQNAGAVPGDRILLRLGNRPETPLAYLAAIAVDMLPVPTSAQLTEVETARIINDLSPALILHEDGIPCPDHPARIDLNALRAMRDLPAADVLTGDPNRAAYIVYTSGTSGTPRAVQHAHRAIWARQMMIRDWCQLTATDRLLHAGAFNWTYTMGTGLMDPWTVGATALIPAEGTAPHALPALMHSARATMFAAAPGVFRKLLQSNETLSLPDLRHGLSAGEKLSPTLRTKWEAATNTPVHEAFGMSECSTFLSGSPANPAKGNATGTPQTGRKIAILDSQGQPTPKGTPGTIGVHRSDPGLMLGYLNAPDATQACFKGDWFMTGDQGVMGDDDQITYLGRADDMMNAGGYRVSPLEVEAALGDLPGVTALAVTDVEAKTDARIIVAFYTAPNPLDAAALDQIARARLAPYKCPRDYIHVATLPVGPNGKLLRKALRPLWRPQ